MTDQVDHHATVEDLAALMERRYGLALPEQMERSKSPAEFLAVVNDVLRKGA